jgi:regulator of sigma E protease
MNNFLISVGGIVILLGVMILIHEWGHFVVARLCGVRVDVFSIGMGPRIWGIKRGPTDYRLSAVPIGGYVRMAGENPAEELTGAPYEFMSKKRWQRALIILAGPTMNIVLAVVIATAILMAGKAEPDFFRHRPEISAIIPNSAAQRAGLRSGDLLLQVNGKNVQTWKDVMWQIMFVAPGSKFPVVVEQNGQRRRLEIQTSTESTQVSMLGYPVESTLIDKVEPGKPAAKDGLQAGDRVVAVNGDTAVSQALVALTIEDSKGKPVQLTIERDGRLLNLTVHPTYGKLEGQERWYIGAYFAPPPTYRVDRLSSAIRGGVRFNVMLTAAIVHTIWRLVEHKDKLKVITGPVGIAEATSQAAREGLMDFLQLMAVISLNLGIVNLLPIPILDGWALLTLGVEGTLRRDLSVAAKERAIQVGVIFLFLLILVVTYNDILRIVTGGH